MCVCVCRYDPETSAAIILTGAEGGEEEEAAMAVCKEAEITNVVKQSEEQPPTKYLKNGKEYMFEDWKIEGRKFNNKIGNNCRDLILAFFQPFACIL